MIETMYSIIQAAEVDRPAAGRGWYILRDGKRIGWVDDRDVAARWIMAKTGQFIQLSLF